MPKVEPPPLANFVSIADYVPQYGDYVVWCKWFTTWHGIVADFDVNKNEVDIIFEGTPEKMLLNKTNYTALYLKKELN